MRPQTTTQSLLATLQDTLSPSTLQSKSLVKTIWKHDSNDEPMKETKEEMQELDTQKTQNLFTQQNPPSQEEKELTETLDDLAKQRETDKEATLGLAFEHKKDMEKGIMLTKLDFENAALILKQTVRQHVSEMNK